MRAGNIRAVGLAISVALAASVLAACGSGDGGSPIAQTPAVSVTTADHLAKLSERVASDLDAGDTCHAAHAADDLDSEIQSSDLPDTLRPGVEEVASRLVDEVNCPPPPPPPPEKKPKKKEENGDHHGDEGNSGQPGHNGGLPPGQAKLKGGVD
ncbi:MAG: hypothetical protein ACJ75Z_03410 [Solirubrobacterales bacterium]